MLWWTLQQLKSSKPEARVQAARKLRAAGQRKAVPALIKLLQDEDRQVRLAVIEALASIAHPASADPLSSCLEPLSKRPGSREENSAEYEALAKALGQVGEPAVIPLAALLSSEDKETRRWAAVALGLVRSSRAVDPLIGKLEDGRSEVRKAAAASLGEIGDPAAVNALIKALFNRDMETRHAAAEALGKIKSPDSEEALIKAVSDQSEAVQLAAIASLGKVGGLKAAARLRAAAGEQRKSIGRAAETALKGMSFSPGSPAEEAELEVIRGDFRAAIEKGPRAVSALIMALGFKDPQMRLKSAESLGIIKSPDAVQPLIGALNDQDRAVQRAAMQALTHIGSPAVGPLQDCLSHYDAAVVRLSAEALGEIGSTASAAALLNFLENSSVTNEYPEMINAVQAAVNALGLIFKSSANELTKQDLTRIAALPQCYELPGNRAATVVDCSRLREQAQAELLRKSFT
jgi:HEAT repeat protein